MEVRTDVGTAGLAKAWLRSAIKTASPDCRAAATAVAMLIASAWGVSDEAGGAGIAAVIVAPGATGAAPATVGVEPTDRVALACGIAVIVTMGARPTGTCAEV
jgi:hypothetical protein